MLLAVHAHTYEQLKATARERLPRGHGVSLQVLQHMMNEGRFEPESCGLAPSTAKAWRREFHGHLPEVVSVHEEGEGERITAKAILRTEEGLEFECVRIPMGRGRYTLCVSSQVGCKMGCTFCETGRMGLIRHLRVDEIVGQVLVARHVLGWPVRNIVFMGMGEALDAPEVLVQVLRVLNDSSGLAMGQERLTVCTVGRLDGIARLREAGFKRVNLSVSLNAANDALRNRIMPVNRKTPLRALQKALIDYRPRRNFTLGVNYCLMPELNDQRQDARDVAAFCAPIERVMVNVIPYNPGNTPLTRAPTDEEVDRFIHWLRDEGLAVRKRVTKGRTVMAACGQLGNADLRRRLAVVRGRPTLDDR